MNPELNKRILTSLVLLPILFFCVFINKYFFLLFLILVGIISSFEWYLMHKKKNKLIFLFGIVFLFVSIFSTFNLRGDSDESLIFFIWILLICFFSDIGGYLFGKTIGGKKLSKISPNKTISGTIGSCLFSFLPILFIHYQTFFETNLNLNFVTFYISLIVSISCQLGDIIISYFKRLRKIKDTGKLLPGHGGMLDRIDGIIFVMPIVFIIKSFILV